MIRVQFWGTRGSITSPGRATQRYGGHTACVEMIGFHNDRPGAALRPDNPRLIIDGGSGLAPLQAVLMHGPCGRGQGVLRFLISHYHWDHVIGLPFFPPMFVPGNQIMLYGDTVANLRSSIDRLFASTYAPQMQSLAAELTYHSVQPQGMDVAGFHVRSVENRHPGGARSFRIQYGPHVVVYSTDHEAGDPAIDARLMELAQGADLWILDAMFTVEERRQRSDWGHSSHLEAIQLAMQAGVQTAVLFHHAPDHNDQTLERMNHEASNLAAGSATNLLMARDGLVVDIGAGQ